MFVPARRQFSVQTGVVWKGVRGILLDAETAECHKRTDKRKEKKKEERKKKKRNLSDKNAPFCQKKQSDTFLGRLKSQIKQKREKQSNGHLR